MSKKTPPVLVPSIAIYPDAMFAELPIRMCSEANMRQHWAVKAKRRKRQQLQLREVLEVHRQWLLAAPPCVVTLIHVGPKKLDGDNLAGATKYVRDALAKLINVDDGDDRVKWEERWEAEGQAYGVRVEIQKGEQR